VFEDGRTNANPPSDGLSWNGDVLEAGAIAEAKTCGVSADDRRISGCAAVDELEVCDTIELDVAVPDDVAEPDPDATSPEGEPLGEVVWVTYLANGGNFEFESLLVSDSSQGIQGDRTTRWVPPEEPGVYSIWAVLRDNRGGSTTLEHLVEVTDE
jgi:hypothetical protein